MSRDAFTAFLKVTLGPAAASCRDGAIAFVCLLTCDLSERTAIDAARRNGIDLTGLSELYAGGGGRGGFLLGFAAYTPVELGLQSENLRMRSDP